jgi:hypothetical protein
MPHVQAVISRGGESNMAARKDHLTDYLLAIFL